MMTIRTKEANQKELAKAVKYAEKLGFITADHPRHQPSFKITTGSDIKVITPIHFEIGADRLVDMYRQVKTLGLTGRICLKALVDAWSALTKSQADDLRNCCWVSSYSATDLLTFFYSWCINQIEKQQIQISSQISKSTARNLWYSLGGYKGLKTFFADGLEITLTEFRRIRRLEEKLEVAKDIIIDNPELKGVEIYTEFNPCLTCKNCKVDKYGCRICKNYLIDIPETMTVKEVNKIYPSAAVINCGKLKSQFVFHNLGDCQYRKERIGCKSKNRGTSTIKYCINN